MRPGIDSASGERRPSTIGRPRSQGNFRAGTLSSCPSEKVFDGQSSKPQAPNSKQIPKSASPPGKSRREWREELVCLFSKQVLRLLGE